ncbi:MAG: hypothetical protein D6739_07770 [Nitrospirae bacterium]|nr:MAG: hypothetical protein D6739_07770 [Nitrospirota bacterium]
MSRIPATLVQAAVDHYRSYRFDRPRPEPPRPEGEAPEGARPKVVVRRRERPHVGRFLDIYA